MKLSVAALIAVLALVGPTSGDRGLRVRNRGGKKDQPAHRKDEVKVKGGKAKKLTGSKAGKDLKTMPQARKLSLQELEEQKETLGTGLYIVDTDFVPPGLEKQLKDLKYKVKGDGSVVDKDGEEKTLIVKGEVYEAEPDTPSDRRRLAYPYPLSQVSCNMYIVYTSGFCEEVKGYTYADAWGPYQGGGRPHTRIQYIETRVEIAGSTDRDSCYYCDAESSYKRKGTGCWWPTSHEHGHHYANFKDGSYSFTRTWSWCKRW